MPTPRAPRRIPVPEAITGVRCGIATRVRYRPGATYDAHCHEHFELFWIEQGEVMHRVGPRGHEQEQRLAAGTLVFIRPDDVHAFATPRGSGFTMVNVVFRDEVVADLERRYSADVVAWPWLGHRSQPLPTQLRLDREAIAIAQDLADALARCGDRLSLDRLLLHLLGQVARASPGSGALFHDQPLTNPPPAWLSRALMAFGEERHLGDGLIGFIALSGRSTAHVNRAIRRHFGRTTTALLNDLRLEHAGRRLRMGDDGVLAIALACGFDSLAHFHRLFRRAHGMTPRAFRMRHRGTGMIGWS